MAASTFKTWRPVILAAIVAVVIVGVALIAKDNSPTPAAGQRISLADLSEAERAQVDEKRLEAYRLVRAGKLAEARPILQELLARFEDDAEAHLLMGQVLLAGDKATDALGHFRRAADLDPANVDAHYNVGTLALQTREPQLAVRHLAAAAKLAPDEPRYAIMLAQARMDTNELDAARVQLLRALELDDNLPEAYGRLADVSAREGNLSVAIDQANKALERVANDPERYLKYATLKAKLLSRYGRPEDALNVLTALPAGQQGLEPVVAQIAQTHQMLSEYDKAAERWADLFAREPTNARAAAEAGLNFHRAGNAQAAERYLSLGHRIDPTHPTVLALDKALHAPQ